MKPTEIAKQWAKTHPDFSGLLGVQGQTGRGKGSWGCKTTTYRFVATEGEAVRYAEKAGYFNGVCDVSGQTYLECVLRWHHLPVCNGRGNFVTTDVVAEKLGATAGMNNESEGEWLHPDYRRHCNYDAIITEED